MTLPRSPIRLLAAVLLAATTVAAHHPAAAKPRMPAATKSLQIALSPQPINPNFTLISADFEQAEGFALAPLHLQRGCQTSGPNYAWASVVAANPASGAQHLRLVRDVAFDRGFPRLAFTSPTTLGPYSPTMATQQIYISNDGGADYYVIGQTPSQNLTAWQVVFSYSDDSGFGPGTIYIVDDLGGGADFVNTHVRWNPRVHNQLKVQFDPPAFQIRYYYAGRLIYTGSIYAATTVEQIVWITDNYQQDGEYADIDQLLMIDSATDPTAAQVSSWGRIKAAYRDP